MRTTACLAVLFLFALSFKAQAETLCMRECPGDCRKRNQGSLEVECFFFCVIKCEQCPDSLTGCPPNEETKKKLEAAKMNGLEKLVKSEQKVASTTTPNVKVASTTTPKVKVASTTTPNIKVASTKIPKVKVASTTIPSVKVGSIRKAMN